MSDADAPSKTDHGEDERQDGHAKKNAWVKAVLKFDVAVRRRMDALGVDAPDPNRTVLRRTLEQQADAVGARLAAAPQADVPGTATAAAARKALDALLAQTPLPVAAIRKSTTDYTALVETTLSEMARVRTRQTELAKEAAALQPPADVDPEQDQPALQDLAERKADIELSLAAAVPADGDLDVAATEIAEYHKAGKALSDQVAERLKATHAQRVANAEKEIAALDVFGAVDPTLLAGVESLQIQIGQAKLTVRDGKAAAALLAALQKDAAGLLAQLTALDQRRQTVQGGLDQTASAKDTYKRSAAKIGAAQDQVGDALTAPLSEAGVAKAEGALLSLEALLMVAQRVRTILTDAQAVFQEIKTLTTGKKDVKTDQATTQLLAKEITTQCELCTATDCDTADTALAKMRVLKEHVELGLAQQAHAAKQAAAQAEFDDIPPELQRDETFKALFAPYFDALSDCVEAANIPRETFNPAEADRALKAMKDAIVGVKEAIAAEATRKREEEEAQAAAKAEAEERERNRPPFNRRDSTTWDPVAPIIASGASKFAQKNSGIVAQITRCEVGDQHGRPETGVPLHHHADNDKHGVAFAYNHLGARQVQPVIYDYSEDRTGNKYNWALTKIKTDKLGGGPPSFPGGLDIVADRNAEKAETPKKGKGEKKNSKTSKTNRYQ